MLNDAEEDLREWRLEIDDVRISSNMLDSNLMPTNQGSVADTSYEEDERTYSETPQASGNGKGGMPVPAQA